MSSLTKTWKPHAVVFPIPSRSPPLLSVGKDDEGHEHQEVMITSGRLGGWPPQEHSGEVESGRAQPGADMTAFGAAVGR